LISIISKANNSFANDLVKLLTKQKKDIEYLDYDRVSFAPQWLKLYLSQKEICLSKNYLSSGKEKTKEYFSFEPLDCADSYYIDGYFSNKDYGIFDFYAKLRLKSIKNTLSCSKHIYTSSNALKNHILDEFRDIPNLKIEVQYPSIFQLKTDYKAIKKEFCKKYEMSQDDKILLFKGDDFINDGGKEFITIYDELCNQIDKKIVAIFVASKSQIEGFRFMARKLKSYENIIFIDLDSELGFEIEDIMSISDIYLHPTHRKKFNRDTIKAMYYKNAVFISHNNFASELVDTFSLIEKSSSYGLDLGIVHKIKALLEDENSLKTIQEENRERVINLNIEKPIFQGF
jgi:hypothetical protein